MHSDASGPESTRDANPGNDAIAAALSSHHVHLEGVVTRSHQQDGLTVIDALRLVAVAWQPGPVCEGMPFEGTVEMDGIADPSTITTLDPASPARDASLPWPPDFGGKSAEDIAAFLDPDGDGDAI